MTGSGSGRRDTVLLLLLAAAGTALGTAGRNGPAAVQEVAVVVQALVVLVLAALVVRWVLRRRRARSAPAGERPPPPAHGSAQWSAQQRPWALAAAPFYGLHLGWIGGAIAWWAPLSAFLGVLALGLVGRRLLHASRRRRWVAARSAHPGASVALVGADAFVGMRLAQWAKAAGVTVGSPGSSDAVLAADEDGLALWRPDRSEPVHRWPWDDVELSRASSSTALPHLVLTLLGPVPAVRTRAVQAARRRFDLALTVRTLRPAGAQAAEAATVAALGDLVARRPGRPAPAAEGGAVTPADVGSE